MHLEALATPQEVMVELLDQMSNINGQDIILLAEAAGAVVPVALTTLDTIFTMAAEEVALAEVAL